MAILSNPCMIPRWAPAFADEVEAEGQEWRVRKGDQRFVLILQSDAALQVVNYLREISPGVVGGAHLRVLPRPGGGSVIVMTLPVPADREEAGVIEILQGELKALTQLSKTIIPT